MKSQKSNTEKNALAKGTKGERLVKKDWSSGKRRKNLSKAPEKLLNPTGRKWRYRRSFINWLKPRPSLRTGGTTTASRESPPYDAV